MGTRNLVCVFYQGDYKIAQYGQWDGYPEGQGKTVLEFLKFKMTRSIFLNNLTQVKSLTDTEVTKTWEDCGATSEWVGLDVSKKHSKLYPSLSRDTGAGILELVQNFPPPLSIQNGIDFAGDSLFCEWCYVIDFDKNTLEVYKGFNKNQLSKKNRFYSFKQDGEYYPVKLAKSYSLDSLPSVEEFLNDLKEKEE